MCPFTPVPDAPLGVMVTVIVPVWPGASVIGPVGGGEPAVPAAPRRGTSFPSTKWKAARGLCAETPAVQMSPVVLLVSVSNRLQCAVAERFAVPAGAGPENGPTWPTSARQRPGDTWSASTVTVAPL